MGKNDSERLLPKTLLNGANAFEALGFTISNDGVRLPNGWTTQESDNIHDFLDLLDEKNRRRGYAFYSERGSGHTALCSRYHICRQLTVPGDFHSPMIVTVQDFDGTVLFEAGTCIPQSLSKECASLLAKAEAYLDEHFPLWRDPWEYWD